MWPASLLCWVLHLQQWTEKRRADEKKRIQEGREYRQRLSDRKDKLAGLIGFREGGDLPAYLDKFEYLLMSAQRRLVARQ